MKFFLALFFACLACLTTFTATSQATVCVPQYRMVTYGEWGSGAFEPTSFAAAVKNMQTRGINALILPVVWKQYNEYSTLIRRHQTSATDKNLSNAILVAHRAGMRTILKPYVDVQEGGFRGRIKPNSVSAWFNSYREFQRYYAQFGQKYGVDGIIIGSEMTSMQHYATEWKRTVATVRSSFKGWVSYQSNWGETNPRKRNKDRVTWWKSVDAISFSAYFPMSRKARPAYKDFLRGWKYFKRMNGVEENWMQYVFTLNKRYNRPILFAELGYRPRTGSSIWSQPWMSDDALTKTQIYTKGQADAYRAALVTWRSHRNVVRGIGWWYVNRRILHPTRSNHGEDHSPSSSSLAVLSDYYRRGW